MIYPYSSSHIGPNHSMIVARRAVAKPALPDGHLMSGGWPLGTSERSGACAAAGAGRQCSDSAAEAGPLGQKCLHKGSQKIIAECRHHHRHGSADQWSLPESPVPEIR